MARIFRKPIRWKSLIAGALAVLLLFGAVFGATKLFGNDSKKIGASAFAVGDIDADGVYKESEVAIYTKDSFLCEGLKIVPKFEGNAEYQIFYFDSTDTFIGASDVMTKGYEGTNPEAERARIVIRPEAPEDVEEFKIRFWEIAKYAKYFTITVDRDQVDYDDMSVDLMNGRTLSQGLFTADDISVLNAENTTIKSTPLFTIGENNRYDYYRVYVQVTTPGDTNVTVAFGKSVEGSGEMPSIPVDDKDFAATLNGSELMAGSWYSVTVKTPKNAVALRVMGPETAVYRIYGFND